MSDKKWYVIQTYSGHENKVKTTLERAMHVAGIEDKFGRILVMTHEETDIKDGVRKTSKRKTYPSYVMVEMEFSSEAKHLVQNIPGVNDFVSESPLKDSEVRRMLGQAEASTGKSPIPTVQFKVGESVRITDGPFNAFTGVVDEVHNERGKVKVMVSIFGRATPVELDFLQVQPV